MGYNIAIDGPAGAGKSTIARLTAQRLGFLYVDTGAMYRTLAYRCITDGVDITNETAVEAVIRDMTVEIIYEQQEQQMLADGENVTAQLRREDVGSAASVISAYSAVRKKLFDLQRTLAAEHDVIMDGRDIGTNVLPDAGLKIYLTASVNVRAKRRMKELTEKGESAVLQEIQEEIERRDRQDMTRKIAPLRQAEDAVCVDTSAMDIPEVSDCILRLYRQRRGE